MHLSSLLVAALLLLGAAGQPTSVPDAQAAVDRNLATAEGKAYDQKIGAEFLEKETVLLTQCKKRETRKPESFWMLLKLDSRGAVRELLLQPSTEMGRCATPDLLKARFAPPPHGDYWVGIYLQRAH